MANAPRWTPEQYQAHLAKTKKKTNKYNATKVPDPENPGKKIDSKREAKYLAYLRQRLREGDDFHFLATQVEFRLEGGSYKADYVVGWIDQGKLKIKVLDAKGVKTQTYKAKKRQMKERYAIEVEEV